MLQDISQPGYHLMIPFITTYKQIQVNACRFFFVVLCDLVNDLSVSRGVICFIRFTAICGGQDNKRRARLNLRVRAARWLIPGRFSRHNKVTVLGKL